MLPHQETQPGHPPHKHTLLRSRPLFQRLEPELVDQLNSHFVKKNIARGTAIFAAFYGSLAKSMFWSNPLRRS